MKFIFLLFSLMIFMSCQKSKQISLTKADTNNVIGVIKSIHFADLKETNLTKALIENNDSTIELKFYPVDYEINTDSIKRALGIYSIYKRDIYFTDIDGNNSIDALIKFSFSPLYGQCVPILFWSPLNQNGKFLFIDSLNAGSHCGDPFLKIDSVSSQIVYITGLGYKTTDSCCCPTDTLKQQYVLKTISLS